MSDFKNAIRDAFACDLSMIPSSRACERAMAALADFIVVHKDPTDEEEAAGVAFVVGHTLGETCALQRAKLALSDPRARGVELAVLEHLAAGLEIEDALRKASAPGPAVEPGSNIIAFPDRR